MAMGVQLICSGCKHAIMAWDEGNPYYLDDAGVKQYAYHPDHVNRERCIGNDSPHLCLACGVEFMVDSREPIARCAKCNSGVICDTFRLEGRRCPYCKSGVFAVDPTSVCIS